MAEASLGEPARDIARRTEVDQPHMVLRLVDEKVLRLYVAVDDAARMDVGERGEDIAKHALRQVALVASECACEACAAGCAGPEIRVNRELATRFPYKVGCVVHHHTAKKRCDSVMVIVPATLQHNSVDGPLQLQILSSPLVGSRPFGDAERCTVLRPEHRSIWPVGKRCGR